MDPIADFLTIIRNGYLAKKDKVAASYSKIKEEIAKILLESKFIKSYKVNGVKLEVSLLYKTKPGEAEKIPALTGIKRVSRPGLRVYKPAKKIVKVLQGMGISIVSTSQGVISDSLARKKKVRR